MTPSPPSPARLLSRFSWPKTLAVLLAGFLIGVLLHRHDTPTAPAPDAAKPFFPLTPRQIQPREQASSRRTSPPRDPSPTLTGDIQQRIEALLSLPGLLQSAVHRSELTELLSRLSTTDPERALQFLLRLPTGNESRMITQEVIAAALAAHQATMCSLLEKLPQTPSRLALLQDLAAAMVETDPDAALTLALEEGLLRDTSGSDAIFLRWAEKDPQAASRALDRLPLLMQRRNAATAICAAWTRSQPEAALAWAENLSPQSLREAAILAGAQQLAQTDPARALALAAAQPGTAAELMQAAILSSWCLQDITAGTAHALGLPDGPMRNRLIAQIGKMLITDDPEKSAELLQELGNSRAATALAAEMAATWAEIDPRATLDWLVGLPAPIREAALANSLGRLVENSPQAAALFAEQATATPALAEHIGLIAARLAATDPKSALAWCEKLPTNTLVLEARKATLESWAARDPAAALAAAIAIPTADRSHLIEQVTSAWALSDPMAAFQWARQQSGDLGLKSAAKALSQLASTDPVEARGQLESWLRQAGGLPAVERPLPGQPHPLLDAAAAVTSSLASNNPHAATEWARNLPDDSLRKEVLSRHFCDWAAVSPKETESFAASLPAGWERDWTLISTLFTYTERNATHPDALRVAAMIQDPNERARAVRLIRSSNPDWQSARAQLIRSGYQPEEIESASRN